MPPENEHQSQRSTPSDIAGIDWLIMSGVSSPEQHPELPPTDPDQDDEEFLQSIGLDEPVPDTSGNLYPESPSQVGGIDWLIVSDVNERVRTSGLDPSSIPKNRPTPQPNPEPAIEALDSLDDLDLNLDLDLDTSILAAETDYTLGLDNSELEQDLAYLNFDLSSSIPADELNLEADDDSISANIPEPHSPDEIAQELSADPTEESNLIDSFLANDENDQLSDFPGNEDDSPMVTGEDGGESIGELLAEIPNSTESLSPTVAEDAPVLGLDRNFDGFAPESVDDDGSHLGEQLADDSEEVLEELSDEFPEVAEDLLWTANTLEAVSQPSALLESEIPTQQDPMAPAAQAVDLAFDNPLLDGTASPLNSEIPDLEITIGRIYEPPAEPVAAWDQTSSQAPVNFTIPDLDWDGVDPAPSSTSKLSNEWNTDSPSLAQSLVESLEPVVQNDYFPGTEEEALTPDIPSDIDENALQEAVDSLDEGGTSWTESFQSHDNLLEEGEIPQQELADPSASTEQELLPLELQPEGETLQWELGEPWQFQDEADDEGSPNAEFIGEYQGDQNADLDESSLPDLTSLEATVELIGNESIALSYGSESIHEAWEPDGATDLSVTDSSDSLEAPPGESWETLDVHSPSDSSMVAQSEDWLEYDDGDMELGEAPLEEFTEVERSVEQMMEQSPVESWDQTANGDWSLEDGISQDRQSLEQAIAPADQFPSWTAEVPELEEHSPLLDFTELEAEIDVQNQAWAATDAVESSDRAIAPSSGDDGLANAWVVESNLLGDSITELMGTGDDMDVDFPELPQDDSWEQAPADDWSLVDEVNHELPANEMVSPLIDDASPWIAEIPELADQPPLLDFTELEAEIDVQNQAWAATNAIDSSALAPTSIAGEDGEANAWMVESDLLGDSITELISARDDMGNDFPELSPDDSWDQATDDEWLQGADSLDAPDLTNPDAFEAALTQSSLEVGNGDEWDAEMIDGTPFQSLTDLELVDGAAYGEAELQADEELEWQPTLSSADVAWEIEPPLDVASDDLAAPQEFDQDIDTEVKQEWHQAADTVGEEWNSTVPADDDLDDLRSAANKFAQGWDVPVPPAPAGDETSGYVSNTELVDYLENFDLATVEEQAKAAIPTYVVTDVVTEKASPPPLPPLPPMPPMPAKPAAKAPKPEPKPEPKKEIPPSPPSGEFTAIRQQKPPSKISPLASIEDLGVEVFSTDDNTDWSGLLESTEVSDSISAVMDQRRDQRSPAKSRLRTELSSLDDHAVREPTITRTQTTSTQTRPEKIAQPPVSSRFNVAVLKGPLIALAVVGVGAGAVVVFQRPILEMALKVGIWKNASGMDLQTANFRGANLAGVSFDDANLSGANFEQANLEDATFIGANLNNASLARANLMRARIIRASVVFTNFNGARLNNADLLESTVERSNFTGAVMRGVNFRGVKLGAGDRTARLDPQVRRIWQIVNQPQPRRNLVNLDLTGANLSSSQLIDANFNGANLSFANLANANLRGANFRGANLRGLNLIGAQLNGVNLRDARLDRKDLPRTSNATICPDGKKGPCKF